MTKGTDPIESVEMTQTGEDTFRPRKGNEDLVYKSTGLTKREYFAAKALTGILSNEIFIKAITNQGISVDNVFPIVAMMAVDQADELIKELNKQ